MFVERINERPNSEGVKCLCRERDASLKDRAHCTPDAVRALDLSRATNIRLLWSRFHSMPRLKVKLRT